MSILKIKDQNGEFVDVPVISGKSATIKVGEVKLLEPTSEPTIENVGTEYDAVFNFGIPKGEYIVQGENFKLDLSDYAKQKQLDVEIENRQQKDNSLQSQIKSLASGSPLVATSTSEMTDKKRVYVNTSDGNWYYYDGSAWISGGVYQSTQNEEVINARKDYVGCVFNTLKENIDTNTEFLMDKTLITNTDETINSINWVLGTEGPTGATQDNTHIIRSNFIHVLKGTKISVNDGYKFKVVMHNQHDNSFIKNSTDEAGHLRNYSYVADGDYLIRICLSKNDDSDINEEEIMTIANNINLYLVEEHKIPDDLMLQSSNLFIDRYILDGYYYDENNGRRMEKPQGALNSHYYPCNPNETIYLTKTESSKKVCFYTNDSKYITGGTFYDSINVPDNSEIKFFRISLFKGKFPSDFVMSKSEIENDNKYYINEKYLPNDMVSDNETLSNILDNQIKLEKTQNELKETQSHIQINQSNLIKNLYFKDTYIDHLFAHQRGKAGVVIPSESIDNMRIAKRLGFKVTEASIALTSDNKYIVMHGNAGCFGNEVYTLNGDDIRNTLISDVTYDYVKTNVRFKSKYDKFKTQPMLFEEWLKQCKVLQMVPYFKGLDVNALKLADKIVGKGNYITWRGERENVDGLIQLSQNGITNPDTFLSKCNEKGVPCCINIGVPTATDEEVKARIDLLHENGSLDIWNSFYDSGADTQRALKLGCDFSTSGWDIPEIENPNICNITSDLNYEDFSTNGVVNGGVLTLSNNQYVKKILEGNTFLSGSSLRINFTGTLHVKLGDFIDDDITSDGVQDNWFSTYHLESYPSFELTSVGDTTINYITYKASKN